MIKWIGNKVERFGLTVYGIFKTTTAEITNLILGDSTVSKADSANIKGATIANGVGLGLNIESGDAINENSAGGQIRFAIGTSLGDTDGGRFVFSTGFIPDPLESSTQAHVKADVFEINGTTGIAKMNIGMSLPKNSSSGYVKIYNILDSTCDFSDDDQALVTASAIKDLTESYYSTSYLAFLCDTNAIVSNQYMTVSGNGISNHVWNTTTDLDYTGTNARTIGHADAHISMNAINLTASIIIPQACKFMGFYAVGRNEVSGNSGPAPFGFGIFHTPESEVNWGSPSASATGNNTILRAYGISPDTDNEKKHQKIDGMLSTPFNLAEGDLLTPTAWAATNDQVKGTITLVFKTLITQ